MLCCGQNSWPEVRRCDTALASFFCSGWDGSLHSSVPVLNGDTGSEKSFFYFKVVVSTNEILYGDVLWKLSMVTLERVVGITPGSLHRAGGELCFAFFLWGRCWCVLDLGASLRAGCSHQWAGTMGQEPQRLSGPQIAGLCLTNVSLSPSPWRFGFPKFLSSSLQCI